MSNDPFYAVKSLIQSQLESLAKRQEFLEEMINTYDEISFETHRKGLIKEIDDLQSMLAEITVGIENVEKYRADYPSINDDELFARKQFIVDSLNSLNSTSAKLATKRTKKTPVKEETKLEIEFQEPENENANPLFPNNTPPKYRKMSTRGDVGVNFSSLPQDDNAFATRRLSAKEIDVALINESLANVNNFSKRRQAEKLSPVLMYEITSEGDSVYKHMTLRELLAYVNNESAFIDEDAIKRSMKQSAISNLFGTIEATESAHHQPKVNTVPVKRKSVVVPREHGVASPFTDLGTPSEDVEFSAVSELRLRDLRRLDFQFSLNEEKSVHIRRHAVIFAMDPIRAVVMASRLILIVPDGADSLLSILDQYMKEWVTEQQLHKKLDTISVNKANASDTNVLSGDKSSGKDMGKDSSSNVDNVINVKKHNVSEANIFAAQQVNKKKSDPDLTHHQQHKHSTYTIPFEAHAFEALLTTVKSMESQEFDHLQSRVHEVLAYFKTGSLLPIEIQEQMRNLKNELGSMMGRISSSCHALREMTEDDEEMALMNLSKLKAKPKLYSYPLVPEILSTHEEIEELLESYLIDFNAIATKMSNLRGQIQSAEELVSLRLDTSRNELLIANTALAVLSCSVAFGAYITGVFGMNLDNTVTIQHTTGVFGTVTVLSFVIMPVIFVGILSYLTWTGMLPSRTVIK